MSFQAYLDNIQVKTGKSAADLRKLAAQKGHADAQGLREGVKAGDIVAWLKQDYDLGHGHSMAVVALLKGAKNEGDNSSPLVGASTLAEKNESAKVGTTAVPGNNATVAPLDRVRADGTGEVMTTNQGVRIADNQCDGTTHPGLTPKRSIRSWMEPQYIASARRRRVRWVGFVQFGAGWRSGRRISATK